MAESYVKHTSAGEMPDTSRLSQTTRRLRAVGPVISEKMGQNKAWVYPLGLVGLGAGLFFLLKRFGKVSDTNLSIETPVE